MIDKILNYRFQVLKTFVLLLTILTIFNFDWGADFWLHATIVRTFSQNLWSLHNPIIDSTEIHTFQTPYHWLLGLLTHLTNSDSFLILRLAGIFNVSLLLFALGFFIKSIFPSENIKSIQFYALLFLLFSTGISWSWSSFLDLDSLIITSCYPSVLANALFLLCSAYWIKFQDKSLLKDLSVVTVILSLIILIHPLTIIPSYVFIVSTAIVSFFNNKNRFNFSLKSSFLVVGLSILIACVYPYFDFIGLLGGKREYIHSINISLYLISPKTMPPVVFLAVIIFIFRDNNNRNKSLFQLFLLNIILLSCTFLYGFISSKYSYGRVISQACILIQIFSGYTIVLMEEKIEDKKNKLLLCLFFCVFILTNSHLLKETIDIIKPKNKNSFHYRELMFLRNYIDDNDVVLSESSNVMIPAFTGKVVYSEFLQASMNPTIDYHKREIDVVNFFNIQTADSVKLIILKRNAVNYVLLKKQNLKSEILFFCTHYTTAIYNDDLWYLFKVN